MKSSTIRRSNLSKEKMAVLEALSKYRREAYDNSPSVYVRPNKEQELDLLWRNFNVNNSRKSENKSPNVYIAAGFVAGAVVMLILTVLISFSAKGINSVREHHVAPVKKEKMSLSFIPSSNNAETEAVNEIYTVQDGDTMEAILVRFYGSYSKEKEALVLKTNNMTNPNKLSIGQQLTIPME